MFRGSRISGVAVFALLAALLAYPSVTFAQRGAGHAGGGTESGESLSTIGKATGVDVKDDLKDFHEALAVQATSQQIVAYTAMLKATAAANDDLKTLLQDLNEDLNKADRNPELATRLTTLEQSIESARTQNKKFLDGFSDRQKSDLKEITRRLTRADSDLAQQAKELDAKVADTRADTKVALANSAQNLDHVLATFQSEQLDLGQEMSIGTANNGDASAFNIPSVKNSITVSGQPIAIAASGAISKGIAEGGQNRFKVELTADMSDLQHNMTAVLRSQLDKADRCGEQIAIQNAVLTPQEPATRVLVQLHFERWSCFGGQTNEMAEGNGSIELTLTPAVSENGTLQLSSKVAHIDGEGLLGESLRSGSLGDIIRDKVTEAVLTAVRQGGDFNATLPPAAQDNATLRRAEFQSAGAGRLTVVLDGEIRVPNEKVTALTSELKARTSSQQATSQETTPEAVPR